MGEAMIDASSLISGAATIGLAYVSDIPACKTIDVSSHSSTLTYQESIAASLDFTGALSADATFQLSATRYKQTVSNFTTGNFSLYVKRGASGVVYFIPRGDSLEII